MGSFGGHFHLCYCCLCSTRKYGGGFKAKGRDDKLWEANKFGGYEEFNEGGILLKEISLLV